MIFKHILSVSLFLHKSTYKMSTNDNDGSLDFLGCIISSFEALLKVTESLNKTLIINSGDDGVYEEEDDPYNEKYDNEDYVPSEEEDEEEDDEEYEEYEEYEDEDDLT